MKKRTRSILEEINAMAPRTTKDQVVEMRSQNVLSGAIQLLEYIEKNFDETAQADLRKRFMLSLKNKDMSIFERGVKKLRKNAN
jgi:hypothetical protein|tara:strand:+ start:825 stop:1076 length:252 start_codon:yes stop_codon:yes gene_type:complete